MRGGVAVALLVVAAGSAAAQARPVPGDRGLDSLRKAVAIDSVDAESFYRLGLGLWERHQLDAADSAFARAIRLQPWHASAHLARGVLLRARGDGYLRGVDHRYGRDSAVALVRAAVGDEAEAITLDPRSDLAPLGFLADDALVPEVRGGFSGVDRQGHWIPPERDPVLQMRRALRLLIAQRPDSAYLLLKEVVGLTTPLFMRADLMEWFALAALRAGHPDEAAYYYRLLAVRAAHDETAASSFGFAGSYGPMKGRYLLLFGMAQAEWHQADIARAGFQQALQADLSLYLAHSRLADLAESEGDLAAATEERRMAIAVAPEQPRPYLDLGITLLQAGHPGEATAALKDAAERLPWDPAIELFLFQAAMASHDSATAQHALGALDRYAPRRNHDQVVDAHHRFDAAATP